MKATVTVNVSDSTFPFRRYLARGPIRVLLDFIRILRAVIGGGLSGRRRQGFRPNVVAGLTLATGTVAPAAVAVADTFSVNGQALTAAEKRANCTVTCGTSIDDADTVTVNGLVLTAKTSPTLATHFLITGVAATDAAALVACINAQTSALVAGIIEAVRPAANGVVNIYAITPGTAGNAYTIATSDAVDLAITNDSSGSFAGGAAAANNAFDAMGNNARTAQALADAINDSTTSIVKDHAKASVRSGVVTLIDGDVGSSVTLDGVELFCVARATDTLGVRAENEVIDEWSIAGNDTANAVSLVLCINAHPKLGLKFLASSVAGVITIREIPPEADTAPKLSSSDGGTFVVSSTETDGSLKNNGTVFVAAAAAGLSGNATTVASSNGSRLPIGGSATRLAGGTSTTFTF